MAEQGTKTVMVGCKLPNGLIMELIAEGHMTQPAPPGPRVTLPGSNSLKLGVNPGVTRYTLTAVDEAFAREWFKRYKDSAYVKQELVFIAESAATAASMAKERSALLTGLEPIAPRGDPRMPQSTSADAQRLNAAELEARKRVA